MKLELCDKVFVDWWKNTENMSFPYRKYDFVFSWGTLGAITLNPGAASIFLYSILTSLFWDHLNPNFI